MRKISFRELLKECKNIRIPEIQRDYAQGRKNETIKEIREGFLYSLLPVFTGAGDEISLDFIYGYKKDDAFEPLDGQQRLTTLFILHWLFAQDGCVDLRDSKPSPETKSRFRYATRISSGKFCDALVQYSARSLIVQWRRLRKNEQEPDKKQNFSDFMKSLTWFEWAWRYDPTVSAMLNMMDSVLDVLDTYKIDFESVSSDKLDKIVFHCLDLDEAVEGFELGEELYVKMNARGRELSPFDKMKSTLEEEIQFQKEEGFSDENLENAWRTRMDGLWADYFWNTKQQDSNAEPTKESVYNVEESFRGFMNRIIAFDLLKGLLTAQIDEQMVAYKEKLQEVCESINDQIIGTVVEKYVIAIRFARQKKLNFPRIDFRGIVSLLDRLFVRREDEKVEDATMFARNDIKWDPQDAQQSLLRVFIDTTISHERRVEFFAIAEFLKGMDQDIDFLNNANDFKDWMRFVRNCTLSRNLTQRIDKPTKEQKACGLISEWMERFCEIRRTKALVKEAYTFREFLANPPNDLTKVGFETSSINEEQTKARLRSNEQWTTILNQAEANAYLWGQLRALLNWSRTNENYDSAIFEKYASKLCELFPADTTERRDKIWKALLCLDDYRFSDKQSLITFDDNRDVSWKRYMREEDNNGCVAPILKRLIDLWLTETFVNCDIDNFLALIISENGPNVIDWRKYVIYGDKLSSECCPERGILVDDNKTEITGHKWFVPKTQVGASRRSFEVFITYLYYCPKTNGTELISYTDSLEPNADTKNSIILKRDNIQATVHVVAGGLYSYTSGDDSASINADAVVTRLQKIGMLPCTVANEKDIPSIGNATL